MNNDHYLLIGRYLSDEEVTRSKITNDMMHLQMQIQEYQARIQVLKGLMEKSEKTTEHLLSIKDKLSR